MTTSYKNYEFTAFSESDLVSGNLNKGDCFTMPASATTCIEVRDNDIYLSGDSYVNENSNDSYGQQASINVDGEDVGNGGQIYAEKYFRVTDENGNKYILIEIEQEGSSQDFFTFYNNSTYDTPPPGAKLTIGDCCNVKGNWLDYKCLDAGDKPVVTDPECIIIEAEDMTRSGGFTVETGDQASGGELVRLDCGIDGALKTDFSGETGCYNLSVFAQDETDGISKIKVFIDGVLVDTIMLDRQSDGGGSNNGSFSEFTIENLDIPAGAEIKLAAWKDNGEFVRIDKIVLKPCEPVPGSLSGRYFCDENSNDVDDAEAAVAGKLVTLLAADGVTVVATTTTATDGTYRFDDLEAGDYIVMFEDSAAEGKEFVAANAGGDDTVDSDVTDTANGKTALVTVNAGQETKDVDAGVFEPVVDPDCIIIEAEDMTLIGGFSIESGDQASGGELVRLDLGNDGALKTNFNGETGCYNLTVHAQDETDGISKIKVLIDGVIVDTIMLDRQSDGGGSNNGTFSEFTIENIDIPAGAQIKLFAWKDNGEFVRIDKIVLKPCDPVDPNEVCVTFNELNTGDTIADQFEGISITATRAGDTSGENAAMVFDTDNPTGGDSDLSYNGLGKVLIISEDGDASDPDDNAQGGTINFDFDNPTDLESIRVLDIEESSGTIDLFDAGGTLIKTVAIPATGNNGQALVQLDATGVAEMVINMPGSGAVDDLCYKPGDPIPGSLSGTYFCDDNRDNDDDGAANGDADIANKTVTLLNADGSPATDIDGNPVATVQTDAQGNYSFTNLAAGDYKVQFEATEGKEFIDQDAGNDDTDDSDVDPANGMTGAVAVNAGQETKDVDAGVRDLLPACIEENTSFVADLDLEVACPVQNDEGVSLCNGEKPVSLTMTYSFGTTISQVEAQDPDKVSVTTNATDNDGTVFLRVLDKNGNPLFEGTVSEGQSFEVTNNGEGLNPEIFVEIYDDEAAFNNNGAALQEIAFHSSCSQPLAIADTFGSVTLTGATLKDGEVLGGTETVILGEGDLIYSIVGGADAALFQIDPDTGVVSFVQAPDFENPQDQGNDNFYDVVVRATAVGTPDKFVEKPLTIEVCDVVETGSLSGTYFCDDNRDNDDDGAANGDADVADKTVTLLNADGSPATDIDGNPVATVQTDAQGNYSFTNLAAGDYKVQFEATEGKEFIDQDAGNDDTDDSDVDPANGTTGAVTVNAGQETKDVDAGVRDLPGSLSGTYFCDENRDNDDDGAANGDADVADKTVTLLNADGTPATDIDGNPVASVQTDAQGNYSFTNLAAGDYKVMFESTDGKEFIDQDAGNDDTDDSDVDPANGMTGAVAVNAGENTPDVDAGVRDLPGSLSGTYFCDENRDNDDDGAANGDADVADKTVTLLNADGSPATDIDGNPVATVQTDAQGNYSFTNLAAGDYKVQFEATEGKEFIDQDAGNDDTDDSDVDPANGTTGAVAVNAGENTPDVDAGVRDLPGSLSGTYFCDENRDNDDDGAANGDADVADKTVTLLNADGSPATDIDGNPVATVQTDAQGNYSFTNLAAGDYKVQFEATEGKEFIDQDAGNDDTDDSDVDPANGTTGAVAVNAGQETEDVDAGVRDLPGSLSGTYFCDENRDNDDDGAANGDADVADKTVTLLNADGTPATDIDGNPVASVQTDAQGNYSFTNLAAGDYKVMFESTDGKEFIDQDAGNDDTDDSDVDPANGMTGAVAVNAGENTPDVDAGVRDLPGSLSGTYFCDDNRDNDDDGAANGDADVADKTVTLLNADGTPATDIDGNPVATVQTDAQGNYSFTNLAAGDYKVMFESTDGKEFIEQDAGNDDTDDSDVDPANGTTGAVAVNAGENTPDVDAGVRDLPGSLSGTYFCDDNRDNDDDGAANGDADVADKTVTLLNADGTPATDIDGNPVATVQTDAQGNYSFTNLAAGDYKVMFEATEGKEFIDQDAGNDDTDDSDVDPANGMTGAVAVNAGQETEDVDAGVRDLPGSLSGTYFCDDNRDNDDDGAANGDADVADKTVTLLNADGTPATDIDGNPVATVQTDAQGNYSFTNLAAGDYKVMFEATEGKEFIEQDAGNDDTDDSDVDPANGMTGAVAVNAGQETEDVDAGVRDLPGSLSGRYFCDENRNDVDDNGNEAAVVDKTVMLFEADGVTPATDIDGNPVASVQTDANGEYSFTNLAAGDYVVMFEDSEAEDKQFVPADAGTDDTVDSDVTDAASGKTDAVTVNPGEETKDVDAGVVDSNPTPLDDEGITCYDEAVKIDVLENDSDPNGDTLSITEINGQSIVEGGPAVQLANGVYVSLVGGKLCFDGAEAFADLLTGEEAIETMTYTVEDGDGNSATADVEVTFCGATDTLEKIKSTLPIDGAVLQIIDETYPSGSNPGDAFTVQISGTGNPLIDGIFENAYCLSVFDTLIASEPTTPIDDAYAIEGELFVATEDCLPSDALDGVGGNGGVGTNGLSALDNLDLINWIINQDFESEDNGDGTASNYTDTEIQGAIWALTDGQSLTSVYGLENGIFVTPVGGTTDNALEIYNAAIANGEGFEAQAGDLVGLYFDPDGASDHDQPFIVAVNLFEECAC